MLHVTTSTTTKANTGQTKTCDDASGGERNQSITTQTGASLQFYCSEQPELGKGKGKGLVCVWVLVCLLLCWARQITCVVFISSCLCCGYYRCIRLSPHNTCSCFGTRCTRWCCCAGCLHLQHVFTTFDFELTQNMCSQKHVLCLCLQKHVLCVSSLKTCVFNIASKNMCCVH